MNLYWIYDLPLAALGVGIVAAFVLIAVLGLVLTRGLVARLAGPPPGMNSLVSSYLSAFGVLYGLTVGLVAVTTWQSHSSTEAAVGSEAAVVAALYRDVSSYPEPFRQDLQSLLKEYTRYVIEEAWPLQRHGVVPPVGTERVTAFQERLYQFEPATPGQETIHGEALDAFNQLIQLRRARLQAVTEGLPAALWWVVILGSGLTGATGFLFHVAQRRLHLTLTVMMAALMGLFVFLIVAMDNPFRGEMGIGPDAFVLVFKGLMGG